MTNIGRKRPANFSANPDDGGALYPNKEGSRKRRREPAKKARDTQR